MRALREVVYDDTGLERERRSLQMALDIASRPAFCYPDSTMRREWVTLRNSLHLALCPSGSMSGRSHDEDGDRPAVDAYLQEEGLPVWSDCCYEDVTPSGVEINVSGAEVDNRHAQRDAPRVDTDRQPIYSSVVRKEFACTMDNSCVLMQRDESICQANRCSQQTEEGGKRVPMSRSLSSGAIQHTERHGEPFLQHNIRVDSICLPARVECVCTEPERECPLVEPGGHLWYKQTEKREWQNNYSEEPQHPREEIDCASTCNECRTKKRDFSVVPTMCPHACQKDAHADICLSRKYIELRENQTEGRCQPAENYSHRDQFNTDNITNKTHCIDNEFQRTEKARPHPESAYEHAFSECKRSWSDGENSHDYQTNGPADQRLQSDGLWTGNKSGRIKQDNEQAEQYNIQSSGAGHRMTDQMDINMPASSVTGRNPLLSEDSESDPWKYDSQPCMPFHLRPHKNCSSTTGSTISVDGHLEEESQPRFAGYMETTNCYPVECNSTERMDAGHIRYPNRSTPTHDDSLQTELPCQPDDIIRSFAHTDMRQPESGFTHLTEESARPGTSNNVRAKVDFQTTGTGWLPTNSVNSTAEIDIPKSQIENTTIEPPDCHDKRKFCQRKDVNFVVKNNQHSLAYQSKTEEEPRRMSAKGVCEDADETHPEFGQDGTTKSSAASRDLQRLTSINENRTPMLPIRTTDEVYRSLAAKYLPIADMEYAQEDMGMECGQSSQNYVCVGTSPIACPGASNQTETEFQRGMSACQMTHAEYPQPELDRHATNIDCSRAHTHWSWLNAKYVRENIEYLYEETNLKQNKLDSSLVDPAETRGEDVEQSLTGIEHGQTTTQCPRTYVGDLVSERGGTSTQETSASRHHETAREDMGKGMVAEKGQRESRLPHTQCLILECGVIQALPPPRADNTPTGHTSDQLNSQVPGIVNDCDCRRVRCLICNQIQKVRAYVSEEDSIECLVAPDYGCSPRSAAPPLSHRSQFPNTEATSRMHTYEPSRLAPEHTVTSDDPWLPPSIVPLCNHTGSAGIAGVECTNREVVRTSTDTCDNTHREDGSCIRDDGAARVVTALTGVSGVAVKRQQVESNKPLKEKPAKRSRRPAKKRRYPDVFHSYAKTALCSESALRADDAVVDKNASSSSLHGHQTAGTSSVAPPNARVPHGYARKFKLRIRLFSGRRLRRLEARRRREEKYHNLIAHSPDSN